MIRLMSIVNLIVAVLVFALSSWMTKRLSLPASRLRLLDHPNERSLHVTPTPRTGGLAILASLLVGLLLIGSRVLVGGAQGEAQGEVSFWLPGMLLLVAAVSLWNDWTELPPPVRLGVHALAAAGVALGAGLTIEAISIPLLGSYTFGWIAAPLTILALMWMTNLYNFMDGMDGFAGGMTVVGFGFLSYLAWAGNHSFMALMALLTAVAAGGFLLYNRPPARIFMGDVGSTLLGFLAGALSVFGVHRGLFELWVPVLIFSPFIVDATVTLLRRLLRGAKVWQPHREHYYQRLVLLGWTHRKTVLAEYLLMLACGLSAVVYQRAGDGVRLGLLLAWIVIYAALAICVRVAEGRKSPGQAGLVV